MLRTVSSFRTQSGVTYLFMMTAVVVMGLLLTVAAKQYKMAIQREAEADLLQQGIEIQTALMGYSAAMKASGGQQEDYYPVTLDQLTRPPRPFLRKPYLDPMTGKPWDYIRAPTGGIMGVRSRSRDETIKRGDFPPAVRHFEGLTRYSDWVFQHPNPSTSGGGSPQPSGGPPGTPPSAPGSQPSQGSSPPPGPPVKP